MAKKELSTDSIREILCRLPVKSLLRFKSVSKPWCCLIDDPYFINFHLKHSTETNRDLSVIAESSISPINLLCSQGLDPPDKFVEINLPVEINPPAETNSVEGITLLGSCNGLICCLIRLNDFQNVIIWNKSTGDIHVTRWPRYGTRNKEEHSPCLMQHGFGYDSINDDYKVVGISCIHAETKVYSLRNNTWKSTHKGLPFINALTNNERKGLIVGGALHWMAGLDWNTGNPNIVVAFDLNTEVFHNISLPKPPENCTALGALGGCLTVTCWEEETDSPSGIIEIWVMEGLVKKSWTRLLRVSASEGMLMEHLRPLAYSRDGNKILLKPEYWRDFLWYNLRNGEVERIPTNHQVWTIDICLDTLVSVSAYRRLGQLRKRNRNQYVIMPSKCF
ncbi:hypothetical protein SLA2020_295160 [Shorea laevis]